MLRGITRGFVNDGAEEREVLALLRMPEDADGEALAGVLERLDGAVIGPADFPEAVPDSSVPLVVVRFHGRVLSEQTADARFRIEAHAVVGELPRPVLVALVADLLRKVLHEIATARDVEQLGTAADRQNGHVPLERGLEQP